MLRLRLSLALALLWSLSPDAGAAPWWIAIEPAESESKTVVEIREAGLDDGPESVTCRIDSARGPVVLGWSSIGAARPIVETSGGRHEISPAVVDDARVWLARRAETDACTLGETPDSATTRVALHRHAARLWDAIGDAAEATRRLLAASRVAGPTPEGASLALEAFARSYGARPRGPALRAEALHLLALARLGTGDIEAAERAARGAQRLFESVGDARGALYAALHTCQGALRAGRWPSARRCYEEAIPRLRELGRSDEVAAAEVSLGGVYLHLADLDAARAAYERSAAAFLVAGDTLAEAKVANNLGSLLRRQGAMDEGERTLRRALATFQALEESAWEARTRNNLGFLLLEAGEPARGREELLAALTLRRAAGDRLGEATTLRNLARVALALDHPDAARRAISSALDTARALGSRRSQAAALEMLGALQASEGQLDRALATLTEAETLRRDLGDPQDLAPVLLRRARVLATAGRWNEALGPAIEAESAFEKAGDAVGSIDAAVQSARVRWRTGDAATARTTLDTALAGLEELRRGLADPLRRAAWTAARGSAYRLVLRLEADAGATPEELLAWSERSRAQGLVDRLVDRRVDRRVDRGRDQRQDRRSVEGSHEASLDATAIRRQLDPGTRLLQTSRGEEDLYVFTVDAETGVRLDRIEDAASLDALAGQVASDLAALDARRGRTSRDAARELSARLLAPVAAAALDGTERLVVVTDGALRRVPFSTLPDPRRDDDTPLLDSIEVVRLASASVLALQRHRRAETIGPAQTAPPSLDLAVLADPILSRDDPRLAARIPSPGLDERSWPRLPQSRREAQAIVAQVAPERYRLALGFEARRDLVLDGFLDRARLLHFATHGVLDAEHPERSGILLSRYDARGEAIEGFLRFEDLAHRDLDAELVVLSGCRTALGRDLGGEGQVGLAAGFLHAGVPRTIATLWEVDDRATRAAMTTFYESLLDGGLAPSAALRAAQQRLRADPRWRDPFYWGAFVHSGDWRPLGTVADRDPPSGPP